MFFIGIERQCLDLEFEEENKVKLDYGVCVYSFYKGKRSKKMNLLRQTWDTPGPYSPLIMP